MKVYNQASDYCLTEGLITKLHQYRGERGFDSKTYLHDKCNMLNAYMKKSGLKACVVAVSGGIDSAVVLGIVKMASNMLDSPIQRIVPLLLPIYNSTGITGQEKATSRGKSVCYALDLEPIELNLADVNALIRSKMETSLKIIGQDWAIGQLGPYSRTPVLYYATSLLSQIGLPAVVCGTTNFDEGGYLGYIGKASDGMVDLQLISDIHKSEVYKIAKELNLPQEVIDVTPTGDMYDNRSDVEVFGASYDFVELYLHYLKLNPSDKEEWLADLDGESKEKFDFYAANLENLHGYNAHKYLSKSPAVHLDLWESSVPGGWDNYYAVCQSYFSEK